MNLKVNPKRGNKIFLKLAKKNEFIVTDISNFNNIDINTLKISE
ncbi:MAG: hypothetical protein OER82_01270 [Nitrosopumilus sp.]|nr:hypothetical protein [Nitrosopumilus sp.]